MKPNFALSLSHEGIGLLHRARRGVWTPVGEVSLAAPDMEEALAVLRGTAVGLEGRGFASKLVIPDSEIRYVTVTAEGPSDAERRGQIEAALEGLTPYAVSDLVYDWCSAGNKVQVAVVARETLGEAEAFAQRHRFNPVSFVARPDPGNFDGEPFFGVTAHAATLLGDAAVVERDTERMEIGQPLSQDGEGAAPVAKAEEEAPAAADPAPPAGAVLAASRAIPRITPPLPVRETAESAPPRPAVAGLPPAPASEAELLPAQFAAAPRQAGPGQNAGWQATGKQDGAETPPRGRTGLALTVLLILVLIAVAIWSLIFLPDNPVTRFLGRAPEVETVQEAPPHPAPESAPEVAAEAPPAALQSGPREADLPSAPQASEPAGDPSAEAAEATEPEAGSEAAPQPEQAPVPLSDVLEAELQPEPEPEPEAAQQDASDPDVDLDGQPGSAPRIAAGPSPAADKVMTGMDALEPPDIPEAAEDVFIATADREILPQDPVTLPDFSAGPGDARPSTPLSPAPAGTRFTLDARGLVIPTREGALTADGLRVFAGRPRISPPPRPGRAAEAALEAVAAPDPLAGKTPRPRPDGLTERNEIAQLGGRTRDALSALRPRPRPAGVARIPAPDGGAVGEVVPESAGTRLAVSNARVPRPRPSDFGTIVQGARTTAQPARSAPILPSRASVTRRATQEDAIRLGDINLIGVYGSAANRRALVRLPSGRYLKVAIGDKVDGGQVAAIGDDSLRYIKRGRAITLKMPSGG
ncbi:hypothetical protein [Maritimibacter sp. 55A14]|uniref:hypothetical protein n=1 Tax=Maritimibacter sp. 55A14 TaxID=2174844 RepID=UPI0011B208B6|nr:hypothetical protein [Maritimibacter sp. 55A14]